MPPESSTRTLGISANTTSSSGVWVWGHSTANLGSQNAPWHHILFHAVQSEWACDTSISVLDYCEQIFFLTLYQQNKNACNFERTHSRLQVTITPPTTTLKRSLHCTLNGGAAVKNCPSNSWNFTPKHQVGHTWEISKTKSSRSWAVVKLRSSFFFKTKAWFFAENPRYTRGTFQLLQQQAEAAPLAADAAASWSIASGWFGELRTIALKSFLVRFSKTAHSRFRGEQDLSDTLFLSLLSEMTLQHLFKLNTSFTTYSWLDGRKRLSSRTAPCDRHINFQLRSLLHQFFSHILFCS